MSQLGVCVWHDVIMQLAKGEMGDLFGVLWGSTSVRLEVSDRIYHSAAFLDQLLSQTALAQEIRGARCIAAGWLYF